MPYGHPEWGKLKPCSCTQEALATKAAAERAERLVELHAQMGPILAAKTFAGFDSERQIASDMDGLSIEEQRRQLTTALAASREYARTLDGWLFLYGPPGTGKSHLAAAVANEVAGRRGNVAYTTVPDLIRFLKRGFEDGSSDERFEALKRSALLVLDDLGTEQGTAWQTATLIELVHHRYAHQLPTVFTTNVSRSVIEPRILDRIDELARCLPMRARSYRLEIRRQREADLKALDPYYRGEGEYGR